MHNLNVIKISVKSYNVVRFVLHDGKAFSISEIYAKEYQIKTPYVEWN